MRINIIRKKATIGDVVWKLAALELGLTPNKIDKLISNDFMASLVDKFQIKHPYAPLSKIGKHAKGTLFEAIVYDVYQNFGLTCVKAMVKDSLQFI